MNNLSSKLAILANEFNLKEMTPKNKPDFDGNGGREAFYSKIDSKLFCVIFFEERSNNIISKNDFLRNLIFNMQQKNRVHLSR